MDAEIFDICGCRVTAFAGDSRGIAVYTHCGQDEAGAVYGMIGRNVTLISLDLPDWNGCLSPWKADKVFRGGESFSGGAPGWLTVLTGQIVPQAEQLLGLTPSARAVAGYSLAGLFAVWAAYNTDIFSLTASVSGSLWFDGFSDYMVSHKPMRVPDKAYFSVGERESRTKNARLAAVGAMTAKAAEIFAGYGSEVTYRINKGGHFDDPASRLAAGINTLTEGS